MSSSLRRGTRVAAVALSITSLTACGAGSNAQSLEIKPDNAAATVGTVKVQNVNFVTSANGDGPAVVTGRLFNDGSQDEVLRSIRVPGSDEPVTLSPAEGQSRLVVPAGGSLALGGENNASARVADARTAGIADGNAQPVVFDLSRTGEIELAATVVPASGPYEGYGPTPASGRTDASPAPRSARSGAQPGASADEGRTTDEGHTAGEGHAED